jgi:predicted  nucleic acid-binding Zn-ribbon protein
MYEAVLRTLHVTVPGPIGMDIAVADLLRLFRPDAEHDPLDVRAREVGEALQRARDLLDELQSEVTARAAIIESLATQTVQAEQRAAEASERAGLSEKASEAVDALLVSAMKTRLGELERTARRREWGLATIVALIIGLIVGVASILISHFAFGF